MTLTKRTAVVAEEERCQTCDIYPAYLAWNRSAESRWYGFGRSVTLTPDEIMDALEGGR